MTSLLLPTALGILVCTSLPQVGRAVPAPSARDPKLVIEAGDHLIHDLIHDSGAFLGRTYLVDKQQQPAICNRDDATGKISVPRRLELDRSACEEVLGQMLYSKGWVACPLDADRGVWDWIYLQGAKAREVKSCATHMSPEKVLERPKLVWYVSTVVSLEHANAMLASANLRTYFNDPRGLDQILPLGGQRNVMVAGFRPAVCRIIRLLRQADGAAAAERRPLEARLQKLDERLRRLEARQGK